MKCFLLSLSLFVSTAVSAEILKGEAANALLARIDSQLVHSQLNCYEGSLPAETRASEFQFAKKFKDTPVTIDRERNYIYLKKTNERTEIKATLEMAPAWNFVESIAYTEDLLSKNPKGPRIALMNIGCI